MSDFETVRFGALNVPDNQHIEIVRGLLGFEKLRRFVYVQREEEAPCGWLQSLEDPQVAFVVANPAAFFPRYKIEIDPRELGDVHPGPNERLDVLGICTIRSSVPEVSMNLLGPVVINTTTKKGKQLVLNRSGYSTQHWLTDEELTPKTAKAGVVAPHSRPVRSPA
jgi:flagellar assembly factor FliW